MTATPTDGPWRTEFVATVKLGVPVAAAVAGTQALNVTDTVIAGHLGEVSLAAVGLGASLFFTILIFPMGVLMGLDPLIAQARGRGDLDAARDYGRAANRLVRLMTVPAMLTLGACTWGALAFGDFDAHERSVVWDYVLIRGLSAMPMLYFVARRSTLQAWDNAGPVAWAMIVGNLVNIPLSCVLGFGDRALTAVGLPPIGLGDGWDASGIAAATLVVTITQFAVVERAMRRQLAEQGAAQAASTDGASEWRPIWRMGWPVGLQFLAEYSLFAGSSVLMGAFGAVAVASHQVALQLISVTFTLCLGLGAAAAVRCGLNQGRGDPIGVRRAGLIAIGLAVSGMLISGTLYLLFPGQVVGWLTDVQPVREMAAGLLVIGAAFQIFDGVQATTAGALRGTGDTRAVMVIAVVGYWGVAIPLGASLAFGFDLGPTGLWFGMVSGLLVTSILLVSRLVYITRTDRFVAS